MKIDLDLKEAQCGDWKIEKFTVSDNQAKYHNLYEVTHHGRFIESGTYWKLLHRREVVMSNTPAEIRDHIGFIFRAKGNVLIAGLGLGMVLKALLEKDDVTHITIVEKSEDVIKLVSPFYKDERVTIVHEDIFNYKPREIFDYGWFDIWTYICSDNYDDMKRLNRKFARSVKEKGHWCYDECKREYKNDKN